MSYIDLSNKAFELSLEATTTATNRMMDYMKSTFDVVAKPYAATTPDAIVRENFDRTGSLVQLRDKYLHETAAHVTQVAHTGMDHAKALQETAQRGLAGMSDVFVSNLNYVKEATGNQIDGFTKHVETASKTAK
ncbi:MAG: hypothetical protein DLM50_05505 [Candidatus Meridianibacter frigidus]|nr:MAG: hypothetical protein DLM50_05505 [Candidatus Eremiobacteraeota bacterium]